MGDCEGGGDAPFRQQDTRIKKLFGDFADRANSPNNSFAYGLAPPGGHETLSYGGTEGSVWGRPLRSPVAMQGRTSPGGACRRPYGATGGWRSGREAPTVSRLAGDRRLTPPPLGEARAAATPKTPGGGRTGRRGRRPLQCGGCPGPGEGEGEQHCGGMTRQVLFGAEH